MEQFSIKDEQIKNLQAMTEKEYETESRELIEMNVTNLWLVDHKKISSNYDRTGCRL